MNLNNTNTVREKVKEEWEKILVWAEGHPRLGWYIATIATLNLILELASLL